MESQLETIDFDDLTARLLEEEQKLVGGNSGDGTGSAMVLYTKDTDVTSVWEDGRLQMACYFCGQGGHMKRDRDIQKFRMRVAEEREKEKRQKAEHAGMAIAQDGEHEGSQFVTIW
jgi:Zinc knuckle